MNEKQFNKILSDTEFVVGDIIFPKDQKIAMGCLILTSEGQVIEGSQIQQILNLLRAGGRIVELRQNVANKIIHDITTQFRPNVNLGLAFDKLKL